MRLKSWWKVLLTGGGIGVTGIATNVSEPAITLAKLFNKNPKRFSFKYTIYHSDDESYPSPIHAKAWVNVSDKQTNEKWTFLLLLTYSAVDKPYRSEQFGKHRVNPVLGYRVDNVPNWLTEDETEYLSAVLEKYFLKRVNRYKDLVDYRKQRSEDSYMRTSEIDKKKERKRLINIYKGE